MAPTTAPAPASNDEPMVKSYLRLRKLLGILGILLPVILFVGSCIAGETLRGSISAFYYSPLRDWFTGILSAMGLFLICYPGYKEPGDLISESWITTIGGIAVIAVGLIPTTIQAIGEHPPCNGCLSSTLRVFNLYDCCHHSPFGKVHLACAALFFFIMGYMAACRFVLIRNEEGKVVKGHRQSEKNFYRACGYIVWASLLAMFIYILVSDENSEAAKSSQFIFWLETIGLWAFGIAWLVKGKIHEEVYVSRVVQKVKELVKK